MARRYRLAGVMLAAAIVVGGGCNRPSTATYTVGRKGGSATVKIGDVTLVFEGVPMAGPDEEHARRGGGGHTSTSSSDSDSGTSKSAGRRFAAIQHR